MKKKTTKSKVIKVTKANPVEKSQIEIKESVPQSPFLAKIIDNLKESLNNQSAEPISEPVSQPQEAPNIKDNKTISEEPKVVPELKETKLSFHEKALQIKARLNGIK